MKEHNSCVILVACSYLLIPILRKIFKISKIKVFIVINSHKLTFFLDFGNIFVNVSLFCNPFIININQCVSFMGFKIEFLVISKIKNGKDISALTEHRIFSHHILLNLNFKFISTFYHQYLIGFFFHC